MQKITTLAAALTLAILSSGTNAFGGPLVVSHDDPKAYPTIAAALDAASPRGAEIQVMPGIYREKLFIAKNNIHITGAGKTPADTVIVYGDGASTAGGTFKSSSVTASGDGFHLTNITVQNDYWLNKANPPSQAVALSLTGDQAVLRHVRLLGHQDTLYANKGGKDRLGRQYFSDCYIEGHVDFIFGNAKAYFENCELHGVAHSSVMYTAQSKNAPDEDSAYVFDHCRLTADPDAQEIALGRAWRPYATVIFLYTAMDAPVMKEGWREWTPGKTDTLKTAYYAEYKSTGIGASPATREPFSHQLTDDEAAKWSLSAFFAGDIGWVGK